MGRIHWLRRSDVYSCFVSFVQFSQCQEQVSRPVLTNVTSIIVLLTALLCPTGSFYVAAALKPVTVKKRKLEGLGQAPWAPRAVQI